jgi:hypothetical protein
MPSWAIYGNERRRGVQVSGVEAYDPSTDAGIVAWYNMEGQAYANNDPVTTIAGSGTPGSGYELTVAGAGNLTFNTNVTNGQDAIINDSQKGLKAADDTVVLNSTTLSVIVMLKLLTGGGTAGRVLSIYGDGQTADDNNTSSCIIYGYPGGSTDDRLALFSNSAHHGGNVGSGAAPIDFEFDTLQSFAFVLDGAEAHVYKGCTEIGAGTAFTASIGGGTLDHLTLMNNADFGTANSLCQIFEVIITTTDLSGSMAEVSAYLTNKYGVD